MRENVSAPRIGQVNSWPKDKSMNMKTGEEGLARCHCAVLAKQKALLITGEVDGCV